MLDNKRYTTHFGTLLPIALSAEITARFPDRRIDGDTGGSWENWHESDPDTDERPEVKHVYVSELRIDEALILAATLQPLLEPMSGDEHQRGTLMVLTDPLNADCVEFTLSAKGW